MEIHPNNDVLKSFHTLMLEALRQREQDVIRFVAILAPALGGFVWLIKELELYRGSYHCHQDIATFALGTVGVLFLLTIGALYSLALGYNYRYITMQLAKIEYKLGIDRFMLIGWPRTPKSFQERYGTRCTPPGVIWIFWFAYLLSIFGVTAVACYLLWPLTAPQTPEIRWIVPIAFILSLAVSSFFVCHLGCKMYNLGGAEIGKWGSEKESGTTARRHLRSIPSMWSGLCDWFCRIFYTTDKVGS